MSQKAPIIVKNIQEFNSTIKKVEKGTTIILKNGNWENVKLEVNGIGSKEEPIIIKAETPGKVILSGNSRMTISGEYITITGFWFKDGYPTSKSIISFRDKSKKLANNCRLTNTTISYYNPSNNNLKSHWVDLWGKNNRVDHNNFTGKTNEGTTLVVWLKGNESIENNHRIDHNFFGKRPELGVNGGETIRIGTSANSMESSRTIVENNTFKNCDGEIEIISNKSANNIFRNNLFLESKGSLTLRHGNNTLVEGNVFLGNNVSKTGGIRVINEGHIVRNNLMVNLQGTDFRGPIVIMNGVKNSPLNRYHQVKNVNIQNNTLINCGTIIFGAGKDKERTLPPVNSIFANNLITNTNSKKIATILDDISGIKFINNIVNSNVEVNVNLFRKEIIDWALLRSLPMPSSNNSNLISNYTDDKSPKQDIVALQKNPFVIGAFNLGNKKIPIPLLMKTGTSWKPDIIEPVKVIKPKIIVVKPGTGAIAKALKKANRLTTLKLKEGIYYVNKTLKVKGNITFLGTENTIIKAENDLPKPLNYFIRVREESSVILKNLTFDGDNDTKVKYAIVSPDKENGRLYNLFIENCKFKNFKNKKGGSIYKAYKGTLADTISIKNSSFGNSYRGLNLSYEKNSIGKYNANVILIHNSVFKNIEEHAINYTKTGYISNIGKGKLVVTNSIFSKVANFEKGSAIRVKNIPNVSVENSIFQNSYNIIKPVSLKGSGSRIENCLLNANGNIKTSNGAIQKHIFYKNPKWKDKNNFMPSKKSILLKENNKINTIGLIKPLKD
jgi:poly(beta-D-mannuronate) lyase